MLSRILEKAIRRSSALDTESLCIVAGQKVFSLRADIHVLDHDGGLIDAACIAVMAALQHFRRPDVSIEGGKVTVYTAQEREPVPLAMLHHPYCVTFSFYHGGNIVLIDATLPEEQVRESAVVVSMNRYGEICSIAKYGGAAVDALLLLNCTNAALTKVQALHKFVQDKLNDDAKQRDAGGLMAELSAENTRPVERPFG